MEPAPEAGEPRLTWDRATEPATAVELHLSERCGLADRADRLIQGDNLRVALSLLEDGLASRFQLLYLDPPFASEVDYRHEVHVQERGKSIQRRAYYDAWPGGLSGYLDMLAPRLEAMHRLLSDEGSLYLHLDHHSVHYVKVLLDEIFGRDNFQREIIWRIGWVSGFKSAARNWIRNHDTLLFYVKDKKRFFFEKTYLPYPPGYRRRDGQLPKGQGIPLEDVWNASPADSLDSIQIMSFSGEKSGFNTQKNIALLERILHASTRPGDLVGDFFAGSGTTCVAAAGMKDPDSGAPAPRRWIGVEQSDLGIALARTRLLERGASAFTIERAREPEPKMASPYRALRRASNRIELIEQDGALPLESWSIGHQEGAAFVGRWHTWRSLGRKRSAPPLVAELETASAESLHVQVHDIEGRRHRLPVEDA
ncbi:MAG: site-specific DNA-methyltransferase [Planctomycetota bacterium]